MQMAGLAGQLTLIVGEGRFDDEMVDRPERIECRHEALFETRVPAEHQSPAVTVDGISECGYAVPGWQCGDPSSAVELHGLARRQLDQLQGRRSGRRQTREIGPHRAVE